MQLRLNIINLKINIIMKKFEEYLVKRIDKNKNLSVLFE
tara:strand:- start:749 stop:865 length:117 start_codon:yes stop_codon:yes gene_type:complete